MMAGVKGVRLPNRLLDDYRWVYSNSAAEGLTGPRKLIQDKFRENFDEFCRVFQSLEDSHRRTMKSAGVGAATSASPPGQEAVVEDEGLDRVLEACNEVIRRAKEAVDGRVAPGEGEEVGGDDSQGMASGGLAGVVGGSESGAVFPDGVV